MEHFWRYQKENVTSRQCKLKTMLKQNAVEHIQLADIGKENKLLIFDWREWLVTFIQTARNSKNQPKDDTRKR